MLSGIEALNFVQDEETLEGEVEIWECYVPLLPAFDLCQCGSIGGMVPVLTGFSAQEIESALSLVRVPRGLRPDYAEALHCMGEAVKAWYNEGISKTPRR